VEVEFERTAIRDTAGRKSIFDIGGRIRQLRKQRGWPLEKASESSGVAHSTLSKIERGELSPTFGTIQKIAAGFGIDIATLLVPPIATGAVGRRSITRAGAGSPHTTRTQDTLGLAGEIANKRMTPFRTRVKARSREEYADWSFQPGEVFVFVLGGTLVIYSEYYELLRLGAGDSVYYDGGMGYLWVSEGPQDAEVLWLCGA
jgi:transcriptional regulator with XRE-family HTH domain